MVALTINNFTVSPFTVNGALIILCMFVHVGVHEIFASSIVYTQSKWICPLIVAAKQHHCKGVWECVHACKHQCLRLNSAASGAAEVWMWGAVNEDTAALYWLALTQIWIKFMAVPRPPFFFMQGRLWTSSQSKYFIATLNQTAFILINKKIWKGLLWWWNGLMEYVNC